MKQRIMAFMAGRYGGDNLSRFTLAVSWVLIILAALTRKSIGPALNTVAMVLLVVTLFRCFSRNTYKRSSENYKFMLLKGDVVAWFKGKKTRIAQSREYRFFRCPGCKVTTRVPRGRGKIKIRCPKCGTEFIKKS